MNQLQLKEKLLGFFSTLNEKQFMNSLWCYEIENLNFTTVFRISLDDYSVEYKSSFSNETLYKEKMKYEKFEIMIGKIFSFEEYYEHKHNH